MNYLYIVVVVIFSFESCIAEIKHKESQERIVGGKAIKIEDAPYQVCITKLSSSDVYELICGGVLVKMNMVLTAAHCIADEEGFIMPVSLFRIYAGHASLKDITEYSDVKAMEVHERYRVFKNRMMWDDLGLITLKKTFKKSKMINAIGVRTLPVNVGDICKITGWGSLVKGGSSTKELREGEVAIYDMKLCGRSYERDIGIPLHPNAICAGYRGGGVDTCDGDFGGPLVCDNLLTGIASFSHGCGAKEYPGVFVELRYYKDWVSPHRRNSAMSVSHSMLLGIILQLIIFTRYCNII